MVPEIQALADSNGMSYDEACKALKQQYDGYHFSEKSPDIYNLFSLINALSDSKLANYRFATGTPTILTKFIKKYDMPPKDFETGFPTTLGMFDTPAEISTNPIPMLYQNGYLIIEGTASNGRFYLSYPNEEIRDGFTNSLMPHYATRNDTFLMNFSDALEARKPEEVLTLMRAFLSSIPYNAEKQVYGNAFALYGLSEYAAVTKNKDAEQMALSLFDLLEKKARDWENGGYFEAFARDWSPISETRLSPKDINCDKSMNTNLHVMEAYSNLYRAFGVGGEALAALLRVHKERILGANNHLMLFFHKDWTRIEKNEISFGHDIEASWLMWEAACVLGDEEIKSEVKSDVLAIAQTALEEGFSKASTGFDEAIRHGVRDTTHVWWVQAEAINGFFNAWLLTKNERYKDAVLSMWKWINDFQIDKENGEWFSEVAIDGIPDHAKEKGGNWKTCYHNGRMCMELLKRRNEIN